MKKILLLAASIFALLGVAFFGGYAQAQIVANPINCADPLQALTWPNCYLVNENYDYTAGLRTAEIKCTSGISGGNCQAPVLAAQISTLDNASLQKILASLQSYKCADMDSRLYAACTRILLLGKSCVDQVRAALTSESSPFSVNINRITSANQIYGANLQAIAGFKITSNTGEFTLKSAKFDFNGAMWPYVKSVYIYDELVRLASLENISQTNFEQVPGGLRVSMPFNEADARIRMGQNKTLTLVIEPRAGSGSFDNGVTMPVNGFRVTDGQGLSQYAPAYILPYQTFTINKIKEDISKAVELKFLGGMMAKNDNANPAVSDSADASITFSLKALDRDIYMNVPGYISGKYDNEGVSPIIYTTNGQDGVDDLLDKNKFTYSCQGCDLYNVNRYIIRQGRTATFVVRGTIYPKKSDGHAMGLSHVSINDDPFKTIGETVYFDDIPNAYRTNTVFLNYRVQEEGQLSADIHPADKAHSVLAFENSTLTDFLIGNISLKATKSDIKLKDIHLELVAADMYGNIKNPSDIVNSYGYAELYDGERVVGSVLAKLVMSGLTYGINFTGLNYVVPKDTTKTLSVHLDINRFNGSFREGDSLRFLFNGSNITGTDASGRLVQANGSGDMGGHGMISSSAVHFFKAFPEISFVSQSSVKKDNSGLSGQQSDSADGAIVFAAKAIGGDIYINTATQAEKGISVGMNSVSGGSVDPASAFTYSCLSGCDLNSSTQYIIREGRTATFGVATHIFPSKSEYYYSFIDSINWRNGLNQQLFAQRWNNISGTFKTNATYLTYRAPVTPSLSKSVELKFISSSMDKGVTDNYDETANGNITFSLKALDRDLYINNVAQTEKGIVAFAKGSDGSASGSKTAFAYGCQNCDFYSSTKYIIRQGQTVTFMVQGVIYLTQPNYYYMGLNRLSVSDDPLKAGENIYFPVEFKTKAIFLTSGMGQTSGKDPEIVTLPWNDTDYKMSGAISLNRLSPTGAYVGFVKYSMPLGVPGAALKTEYIYWPSPFATIKKAGDIQTFDIRITKPTTPTLVCYDAFVKYESYYKKANMQQCRTFR